MAPTTRPECADCMASKGTQRNEPGKFDSDQEPPRISKKLECIRHLKENKDMNMKVKSCGGSKMYLYLE